MPLSRRNNSLTLLSDTRKFYRKTCHWYDLLSYKAPSRWSFRPNPACIETTTIEKPHPTLFHEFEEIFSLVIGNGQSGTDISIDLVNHAKSITLIGKNKVPALPENIFEVTNWFKSIVSDGIILENGDLVKSDVFILCTGYIFDYSFAQVSYKQGCC